MRLERKQVLEVEGADGDDFDFRELTEAKVGEVDVPADFAHAGEAGGANPSADYIRSQICQAVTQIPSGIHHQANSRSRPLSSQLSSH